MVIGEEGTMIIPHVSKPQIFSADKTPVTDFEMADGQNHYHGWVDGCLSSEQPSDGFDYGGLLTETVLLGNIAIRFPGQTLKWDAPNMKVTNIEEANKWVTRDYREGWKIEAVV